MVSSILLGAVLASGCAGKKSSVAAEGAARGGNGVSAPGNPAQPEPRVIVTPENTLVGKVARVNPTARFVVVNFPVGRTPGVEQIMPVYRNGLKVGEIKVTGMRLDDNVVADLWKGEAEVGDEVRDR